jgi:hypothetical protein
MNTPAFSKMGDYSDLIDTIVCTLFGTASIVGAAWLLLNLDNLWSPAFFG